MKPGQYLTLILTLLLSMLFAACGSSATSEDPGQAGGAPDGNASTAVDDLDGSEWVLTTLNGGDLVAGSNITLNFENGEMGGFAGCNSYGGPYAAGGGVLEITEISSTAQDCESPAGVMDQEIAYLTALGSAATYRLAGERLEISNTAGEIALTFTLQVELPMNPDDLEGTAWQLLSLDGGSPAGNDPITITFAGGMFSGSAGCRSYSGSYLASGDDISFPQIAMLELDCIGPEAIRLQEATYTDGLSGASGYRLSDGQLEIFTVQGGVLLFGLLPADTPDHATGTTWILSAFVEGETTSPLLADTIITLTFEGGVISESGLVRGEAGCNQYGITYTFGSSPLTFDPAVITRLACEPPEVMVQEQHYLEVVQAVEIYYITGNQLRLDTADGRGLIFTAQE